MVERKETRRAEGAGRDRQPGRRGTGRGPAFGRRMDGASAGGGQGVRVRGGRDAAPVRGAAHPGAPVGRRAGRGRQVSGRVRAHGRGRVRGTLAGRQADAQPTEVGQMPEPGRR